MKLFLPTALAWLIACLPTHAQLTLNSGEVFTYEFTTLPLVGPVSDPLTPLGNYSAILNPSTVQAGDIIQLEMFENALTETPIDSRVWMNSSMVICQVPFAWADRQGALRLTMVSGSATVDTITIRVLTATGGDPPLNLWSSTFVPVPEPGMIGLMSILCLAGFGWRVGCPRRNAVA